jgi:SAM-dependent methyltransferase
MNRLHRWYCRTAHWRSTLERLVPWTLEAIDLGDRLLELGPGPGFVTSMVAGGGRRITAIEIDAMAASELHRRGLGIDVVRGDAATLPFASATFSAVLAFTMLHHLPDAARQQALFAEVARTLRPGGVFVAVDIRPTAGMRLAHLGDRFTPLAAGTMARRLAAAGLTDPAVSERSGYLKLRARAAPARLAE